MMKKLVLGISALLAATSAQAIIPTLIGAPVDIGEGIFRYTYSAVLSSNEALTDGSYFTLYDIREFQGIGAVPAGFTGTAALLGVTPGNVLPDDDANEANATFTYNGPTINFDQPTSEVQLGNFEILARIGTFGFDDFTSEATRNTGPTAGSLVAVVGEDAVAVPGGGDGIGSTVPEPESWALMIVGFALVGGSMRRRSKVVSA